VVKVKTMDGKREKGGKKEVKIGLGQTSAD
jgi:hypothetical protein